MDGVEVHGPDNLEDVRELIRGVEHCQANFHIEPGNALAPLVKAVMNNVANRRELYVSDANSCSTLVRNKGYVEDEIRKSVKVALCKLGWHVEKEVFDGHVDPRKLRDMILSKMLQTERVVGYGSYSFVSKAVNHVDKSLVAIKTMRSFPLAGEGIPSNVIREMSMLQELSSYPNFVKLLEVLKFDDHVELIFEWIEMDIQKYLQTYSNIDLHSKASIIFQILKALSIAHAHGVLHRDLKPSNILIDPFTKRVKIADLGLSRWLTDRNENKLTREVVTLQYRAPELILGTRTYNESIDIWSTGCIFAEVVLGHQLFAGQSEIDQLFNVFQILGTPDNNVWPGVEDFPEWQNAFPRWQPKPLEDVFKGKLPAEGIDLLISMLQLDPQNRITASAALSHPFFENVASID